jgi:ABC-type Fe3+-siderophore transport system permease subunit
MGVDVMIILLIGISIEMCLAAVTIAMLYNIKKSNDAWWRTYWAKDKIMMDKILEIERMWRNNG